MAWSLLESIIYGFISGFLEFLPISSDIHRVLFRKLTGLPTEQGALRMAVHMGAFLALLAVCRGRIGKLLREKRFASVPPKRRKRQPDVASLMEFRLLKLAMLPLILSCLLYPLLSLQITSLWLMSLITIANGIVLLWPQYHLRANKDARSLSRMDALLIGLGGAFSVLPGMSYVGALTSSAQLRGADRQFGLNFCYLLMIPVLICLCIGDGWMIVTSSGGTTAWYCLLGAGISAFIAGSAGLQLMRFLAVKVGFSEFAYYCWGIGFLGILLYLVG